MSRLARRPIEIPSGVTVQQGEGEYIIKGPKAEFVQKIHSAIDVQVVDNAISVALKEGQKEHKAQLGTTCVLLKNCIVGVTEGFTKKLSLVGVGYRAKVQGKKLELNLGYSHPVFYEAPEGITIETPSATEVVVSGPSKQKVGQVAAEIRSKRPPESYKGKGVRYADEHIAIKETKKK